MKAYLQNKIRLAEYVNDIVLNFVQTLPLTMTITPDSSGAYSVSIATDALSDDTDPLMESGFLATQVNI